jgi:pimeloyl-ACP methyl ester carboxylesterase
VKGGPAQTFLLLHGSCHGGWCWTRVAEPLRAAGHRVFTPTLTGLGERSHLMSGSITLAVMVKDIVNVLEFEDLSDVVIAAHSFGGVIATGVADRVPGRIRHLVLLDSLLVLQSGQSAFMALPAVVAAERRRLAQACSGGMSVPVPAAAAYGITDALDAAWIQAKCTPQPLSSYDSPLHFTGPIGNGLPVTYVAVTPHYAATVAGRDYARTRADWRYLEIEAGHDAMVTSPQAVLDILLTL